MQHSRQYQDSAILPVNKPHLLLYVASDGDFSE